MGQKEVYKLKFLGSDGNIYEFSKPNLGELEGIDFDEFITKTLWAQKLEELKVGLEIIDLSSLPNQATAQQIIDLIDDIDKALKDLETFKANTTADLSAYKDKTDADLNAFKNNITDSLDAIDLDNIQVSGGGASTAELDELIRALKEKMDSYIERDELDEFDTTAHKKELNQIIEQARAEFAILAGLDEVDLKELKAQIKAEILAELGK